MGRRKIVLTNLVFLKRKDIIIIFLEKPEFVNTIFASALIKAGGVP